VPDELEAVLRLVADGRLTPEEAAPIIEALTRAARHQDDAHPFHEVHHDDGYEDRIEQRVHRSVERANRRAARAMARAEAATDRATRGLGNARARQLRIRVTERGRQVVNLRIPIGFVDTALRFVPGLAGEQADRIRDAVRAGASGPIIDVEDADGEGGVLISVE
jgi:hypothetical protein